MAAIALRSFLGDNRIKIKSGDLDDIYHRLVEAECNNREFVARIAHDIRTPLNNIKGAVYYLKGASKSEETDEQDFYEIIEKEVNYLISYLDDGIKRYEDLRTRLVEIEEKEKYKNLLK
jgi:signal transduction histidine kinase